MKKDVHSNHPEIRNSKLENECALHMEKNGFKNVPQPLDVSGKLVKFSARSFSRKTTSEDITEWYHASITDDGKLLVTYNSHHDSLKRDKHYVFASRANSGIDENEARAVRERVAKMQQERKKKKEAGRQRNAERDRIRFNKALENGFSQYLERKKVGIHGVRFEWDEIKNEKIILIPMRDANGNVQALQEIFEAKRTFAEGVKPRDKNFTNSTKGLFHTIGNIIDGQQIRISEGYATAASCYASTGFVIPHVVAFSAGAYKTVIPILRKLYPNSHILICADDNKQDDASKINTGVRSAEQVTTEVSNCSFVYPIFPVDGDKDQKGNRYADFNDLMLVAGKEEVKKQIEGIEHAPVKPSSLIDSYDLSLEEGMDVADVLKARATARRRALISGRNHHEVVKDLRKQYPVLRDQAEDIASKAILWAQDYEANSLVNHRGIPKKITDMASLDLRFAQLEAPGQPCLTIHRPDAQPISHPDFLKRLSGEIIISGVDSKGQPKYLPASTFWNGNAQKLIFRSIAFTSKPVENNVYNLFTGFGIKPKLGECNRLLAHIRDVICSGNEKNYTALIKLLSWQIQNIGKPSRIIVALKSKMQQIGKGCLLSDVLAVIYGTSGFVTSDLGKIITRFNDTIRGKAYIFLDEALFAGDRKAADAIKSLATATYMGIESKGIPTMQLPVAINLFLATNHDDAAHIEESDVRYWIFEVSPHRAGDVEYFKELYVEIEDGGREAFMFYLLNFDIRDFVPWRDVPKDNESKDAMIRNSIIFQGALSFIMRNLHKIQKQKGVNTIGEPEIPQIVFEELLVNALIHRDYFVSAPVRLFIFDDRVEIINPGNLPDHLTIEKIRAGNSIQRNPILASFAAKGLLPYRGLGTGVRRALQDWPQIQFIDDRDGCLFTSLVERSVPSFSKKERLKGQDASINAPINASLSDLQIQMLKIIENDPWAAYEDIAVTLEKDRSTIRRNIQQLKSLGILQRSGSKKKGSWVIVK